MAINLASGALTLIAHFLVLDSPVALRKLLRRFSALRLENSAQNFRSCYRRHDPTASPATKKCTLSASAALFILLPLPRSLKDCASLRILKFLGNSSFRNSSFMEF